MTRKCIIVVLLAALALAAQEARLTGPVSGFVVDSQSGSIRPILGVPGASYLGDALLAGLDWASVAPDGKAALAVKGESLYLIRGLDELAPSSTAVGGAIDRPDLAAWSRDASVAVLYSSAGRRLQVIAAPAGEPVARAPVELPELQGRVTALALDCSGEHVLVGVESDGVHLLSPGTPPALLAPLKGPVALTLAHGERTLFVADRASRQVFEIRDFAAAPKLLVVADASDPVGLGLSRDEMSLFVASGSERSLDIYDLSTRSLAARIALDAEPSRLNLLSASALYLLNSVQGGDPLLVLDASREPGVFFVPVGRGE